MLLSGRRRRAVRHRRHRNGGTGKIERTQRPSGGEFEHGKSVLFHRLTGRYGVISNYPGTTVEETSGRGRLDGSEAGVLDTPGIYSLVPTTEEERVTRSLVFRTPGDVLVSVIDTRSMDRSLSQMLQLARTGLPPGRGAEHDDEAE